MLQEHIASYWQASEASKILSGHVQLRIVVCIYMCVCIWYVWPTFCASI